MSTAQKLHDSGYAEGRIEGEARGEARGRADLLVQMLTRRFGELDTRTRAAIAAATPDQVADWSVRLIDGTLTLDALTSSSD